MFDLRQEAETVCLPSIARRGTVRPAAGLLRALRRIIIADWIAAYSDPVPARASPASSRFSRISTTVQKPTRCCRQRKQVAHACWFGSVAVLLGPRGVCRVWRQGDEDTVVHLMPTLYGGQPPIPNARISCRRRSKGAGIEDLTSAQRPMPIFFVRQGPRRSAEDGRTRPARPPWSAVRAIRPPPRRFAKEPGLEVKRGIVVDDCLRHQVTRAFCWRSVNGRASRPKCYGLWLARSHDMARTLAAVSCRPSPVAGLCPVFPPSRPSSTVTGIDVLSSAR